MATLKEYKGAFFKLADYYLSQDHECENLLSEIKSAGYDTKKEIVEHYKNSMYYEICCVYNGKRQANKDMYDNLERILEDL